MSKGSILLKQFKKAQKNNSDIRRKVLFLQSVELIEVLQSMEYRSILYLIKSESFKASSP